MASPGGRSTCTSGPDETSHLEAGRLGPWPSSIHDQAGALRRLPAAFGFIEALAVVDHKAVEDEGDNEGVEEEDGTTGPPVASEGSRRFPRGVDLTAIQ